MCINLCINYKELELTPQFTDVKITNTIASAYMYKISRLWSGNEISKLDCGLGMSFQS